LSRVKEKMASEEGRVMREVCNDWSARDEGQGGRDKFQGDPWTVFACHAE
jgi:hypothetical protein